MIEEKNPTIYLKENIYLLIIKQSRKSAKY